MPTVRIPIMSCPECGTTFNVRQWLALELAGEQPKRASLELRLCSSCGLQLATNPEGLDQMDCAMDAEQYAMIWPMSELPGLAMAQESRIEQLAADRKRRAITAALAAALLAAVLVAILVTT